MRGPSRAVPRYNRLFAPALREALRSYDLPKLWRDLLAGVVVGIIAVPLSMALAIATGVPPQFGLYTAAFAGIVGAVFGGCRFQVTGPTAAFVVVLAPIVSKQGTTGLLVAGFLAGLMLVAAGWAGLGRLIEYIPHPVTTGFTSGIGVVIAILQLPRILGVELESGAEVVSLVPELFVSLDRVSPGELSMGLFTLALLILAPRMTRRMPAPLLALPLAALAALAVEGWWPAARLATIGSEFSTTVRGVTYEGIPPVLPEFALPRGLASLSWDSLKTLIPSAVAIAALGGIESLLSAVVADGSTNTRHDPDAELTGQGLANMVVPFFGGIPATGALARTATNIRFGAVSPLAAVFHSLFVLLVLLALAPVVALLPMAALAALLLTVAWNMADVPVFWRVLRRSTSSDSLVLVTCFGLTVVFDMVVAIVVGVLLAALLFMRRMAELTSGQLLDPRVAEEDGLAVPPGVLLYRIHGPLFFGAAQKAMAALVNTKGIRQRGVVLDVAQALAIDSTGMVALESAAYELARGGIRVAIAGPLPEPHRIWEQSELSQRAEVRVFSNMHEALAWLAPTPE